MTRPARAGFFAALARESGRVVRNVFAALVGGTCAAAAFVLLGYLAATGMSDDGNIGAGLLLPAAVAVGMFAGVAVALGVLRRLSRR